MRLIFGLLVVCLPSAAQYVNGYNHILHIGQSLCMGTGGTPPLSTTQPYSNLTPSSFLLSLSLVPLTSTALGAVTNSADLETPQPSHGNNATFLDPANHQFVVSKHCVSGTEYNLLKKGTSTFTDSIVTAQGVKNRATAAGLESKVIVVTATHGGKDVDLQYIAAAYQHFLQEWQNDYQADINAATGRTGTLPLFISQFVSSKSDGNHDFPVTDRPNDLVANTAMQGTPDPEIGVWWAARDYPDRIYAVTQRFASQFTYSSGPHLDEFGYQKLGAYYAKYTDRIVREGNTGYRGLVPRRISISGAVIDVQFWVPVPPLVIDTTTVSNPGGYGFAFSQVGGNGALTIAGVALKPATTDTVQVTLSAVPTGTNQLLGYGLFAMTGARGNIRDSDTTLSREGTLLQNWSISWLEPVGFKWEPDTITPLKIQPSYVTVGQGQQFTLTAADGIAGYLWTIPSGCTELARTATTLTTTCASAGRYNFRLTDGDSPSQRRDATVDVKTGSTALAVWPAAQTSYQHETVTVTASGGTVPYAWSAPGCVPAVGSGSTFQCVYNTAGSYTISLVDGASAALNALATVNPLVPPALEGTSASMSGRAQIQGRTILK